MEFPESEKDLNWYIDNNKEEDIHLDYKDSRSLLNKKEISKDVSAFANSDGGLLIYGIQEEKNLPVEVDEGVSVKEMNRERLEDIITSNVSPRIDGLIIRPVRLSNENYAYVIKIPKSSRAPHFDRKSYRYYKRFNFKSEPMEEYEINDVRSRASYRDFDLEFYYEYSEEFIVYLTLENIASVPVYSVQFEFPENFKWSMAEPDLVKGIDVFSAKQKISMFYGVAHEILDENEYLDRFDVSVSYYDSDLDKRVSRTFQFDFSSFSGTNILPSDDYKVKERMYNELRCIKKELSGIKDELKKVSNLTSSTGLRLSVKTMRGLASIFDHSLEERYHFRTITFQQLAEIMEIDQRKAMAFMQEIIREKKVPLCNSEILSDEELVRLRKLFIIDDE